jgi:hypothetical protein
MSTSVNTSFITQWNDEVKQAYQQKGSKLRDAVLLHLVQKLVKLN